MIRELLKKLSKNSYPNYLRKHLERYKQFGITLFQNFFAVLGKYSDKIMVQSKPKGEGCL